MTSAVRRARDTRPLCVLTIAGSDSGGGAGIQADLKTFAAHRVHGLSAITAVTAQNTRAVTGVAAVPPMDIERQIDAVFDDFRVGAVKLGMLGDRRTVRIVARTLSRRKATNVVLDPVMVASSGARLLREDAVRAMREELLPLARVVTPNLPEAEWLLQQPVRRLAHMPAAAQALRDLGSAAVLLKGGHLSRGPVVDLLLDERGHVEHSNPRLARSGHGTGCTLASAIAARLARGETLRRAVQGAVAYVQAALAHGFRPGRGKVWVLDHLHTACTRIARG